MTSLKYQEQAYLTACIQGMLDCGLVNPTIDDRPLVGVGHSIDIISRSIGGTIAEEN